MSYSQIFTSCPGVYSATDYNRFNRTQRVTKADPKNFDTWRKGQPKEVINLVTPCKDPRWGKIHYESKRISIGVEKTSSSTYVICLDSKSEYAGNIYMGEPKHEIYVKIFCSAILRPVHMAGKFLYHATLIGVARVVLMGILEKKPAKQIGKSVVRNLVDIVRTPIYETALLIVSLVALVVIPFSPKLTYDFRAALGSLSNELYWSRRYEFGIDLTPCMRRRANVMDFEQRWQRTKKGVIYRDENNLVLRALDNGI